MMFSSLSTLVQFIGAIYVTIVFDNILFRRFWSPDYYSLLHTEFRHFGLPETSGIDEWLDSVRNKNHIFQEHSRKRGTIFLYTSFMTLMSCAIIGSDDSVLEVPFITLYTLSYIVVFLMPSTMSRWIWLLLALFCVTILFIISCYYQPFDIQLNICEAYKRLTISLLLLFPIIYQIVKSWLYSTALKCYFIQELNHISSEYKEVRRAFDEKNPNCIPTTYKDAFVLSTFAENNKEDLQLTGINKILVEQLSRAFSQFSLKSLLKAYLFNPPKNEYEDSLQLYDEDQSVNTYNKENITYTDIQYVKSLVALYEKTDPKPKIAVFCQEHRIDEETFRGYRNKNNHKK